MQMDREKWTRILRPHAELDRRNYIAQTGGTCCFVWGALNCMRYLGREFPEDIKGLCEYACCMSGPATRPRETIAELELPLVKVDQPDAVFERGGILKVMHPIINGHAFFVYPINRTRIVAVNSWLGPNRFDTDPMLIRPLVKNHLGGHWVLEEGVKKGDSSA